MTVTNSCIPQERCIHAHHMKRRSARTVRLSASSGKPGVVYVRGYLSTKISMWNNELLAD